MADTKLKQCSGCGAWKPFIEFPMRKKTGKLEAQCKSCYTKKSQEWYRANTERGKKIARDNYQLNKSRYKNQASQWRQENPERRTEIQRTWRWKERLKVIEAYGGKCMCCGETIPEFLSIDHIN